MTLKLYHILHRVSLIGRFITSHLKKKCLTLFGRSRRSRCRQRGFLFLWYKNINFVKTFFLHFVNLGIGYSDEYLFVFYRQDLFSKKISSASSSTAKSYFSIHYLSTVSVNFQIITLEMKPFPFCCTQNIIIFITYLQT